MTQIAIQKQVEAIIKATKEAGKTKETARQFLVEAGILQSTAVVKHKNKQP